MYFINSLTDGEVSVRLHDTIFFVMSSL